MYRVHTLPRSSAPGLAKFDRRTFPSRYFRDRWTIKFPLTACRQIASSNNSSIESPIQKKEKRKKERNEEEKEDENEEKKKKTEQMIESSFSIGESCHDERHVFPLSISSDHGLRLINFHGWGNLWIDGARSQRIMTQGSRLLRRCSLTEARGQLGRNASIVSHYF